MPNGVCPAPAEPSLQFKVAIEKNPRALLFLDKYRMNNPTGPLPDHFKSCAIKAQRWYQTERDLGVSVNLYDMADHWLDCVQSEECL